MKVYNNIHLYLTDAKENDVVAFGGLGLIDGLKNVSKKDTYKVVSVSLEAIRLKGYNQRYYSILLCEKYNQSIAVLTANEFKHLPTYITFI